MQDDYLDDEWSDDDWSDDESYDDDDDETEVVSCPNCKADVYEDAEQCPVCGEYIIGDRSAWSGRPMWYVLLGLAGVIAVIAVLSGLMQMF